MKRICITLLACSTSALVAGCGGSEPGSIEIGDLVPAFSLPAVSGTTKKVTRDDLKGKIAIVNFWSTSCSVCLKESEDLTEIHRDGRAFVLGIALDEDAENLSRFVKERGIKYPVALGNEKIFMRFDGAAIPYTLVLDRAGAVRKKVYGRIEAGELARVIDEIDRSAASLDVPQTIGERTVLAGPATPIGSASNQAAISGAANHP